MAIKNLSITLLLIHISIVFCRSTVQPVQDAVPVEGTMASNVYVVDPNLDYNTLLTTYTILAISLGIFTVLSLILGCIMYYCCKKEPRRGYVIRTNTEGHAGAMSQQGTVFPVIPGSNIPVESKPPSYTEAQQQNTYPNVHPAKY